MLTTVSVTETEGMLATFVPPKADNDQERVNTMVLLAKCKQEGWKEGPTEKEKEGCTDVLCESSDD